MMDDRSLRSRGRWTKSLFVSRLSSLVPRRSLFFPYDCYLRIEPYAVHVEDGLLHDLHEPEHVRGRCPAAVHDEVGMLLGNLGPSLDPSLESRLFDQPSRRFLLRIFENRSRIRKP